MLLDIEWIVGTLLNEVFVINHNCIIVQHILPTVAIEKVQKNIHFSEHVINSPNNPSNRMDCYANGKINALNAFSHQLHITPWLNVKTKDFIQGWLQYNCSVASSITSSLLQDQLHALQFPLVVHHP